MAQTNWEKHFAKQATSMSSITQATIKADRKAKALGAPTIGREDKTIRNMTTKKSKMPTGDTLLKRESQIFKKKK
jgi:hypothetical protein